MTGDEKTLVRELACAYVGMFTKPDTKSVMDAVNAEIENASQNLPWKSSPERADYLDDVAFRAARIWSLR